MKKRLLAFIFLITLFTAMTNINGYTISDSNNPGESYTAGGATSKATEWISIGGASGTQLQVVRIRIFRNGKVIPGMDKYYSLANTQSGCYSSISSVYHCKTSSYNYSSVSSKSGLSCTSDKKDIAFGCIYGQNLGKSFYYDKGVKAEGEYLNSYFTTSNYTNLKQLLKTMGYDNSNFNDSDIVIVEPATVVNCNKNKYFGTSTALMKNNVSYSGASGNVCSANDNYKGYTFQNVFRGMSQALSQNGTQKITSNSSYTGFGFFKYDVSGLGYQKPGNIEITKINDRNNVPLSGVQFNLYNSNGCETANFLKRATTDSEGKLTFSNLTPDLYYVYERYVPTGYKEPENRCIQVRVYSGSTTKKTIKNTPSKLTCEERVSAILNGATSATTEEQKQSLINLYREYLENENVNRNLLLDFNNPSCGSKTCSIKYSSLCSSCAKESCEVTGELNTSANNNQGDIKIKPSNSNPDLTYFSSNDLSCYNDIIEIENNQFYCNTYFYFTPDYGKGYTYNSFVNAGMFLLWSMYDYSFSGRLYKECYIYGYDETNANDRKIIIDAYNSSSYKSYVSEIKFSQGENEQILSPTHPTKFENPRKTIEEQSVVAVGDWKGDRADTLKVYSVADKVGIYKLMSFAKYKLPENYLEKGTGKVRSKKCSTCNGPIYGLYSYFTDNNDDYKIKLDYTINYPEPPAHVKFNFEKAECSFDVDQQIIKPPSTNPNNHKLQLVFRTIETNSSKAFLDKYGNSRNPGSNWAGIPEGESSKTKIQKYLDERNNSYNRTGDGAKYTIELTPSIINKIRDDNKDVPYDEWVSTSNSTFDDWKSAFLRDANIFSRATYTDDRMYLAG